MASARGSRVARPEAEVDGLDGGDERQHLTAGMTATGESRRNAQDGSSTKTHFVRGRAWAAFEQIISQSAAVAAWTDDSSFWGGSEMQMTRRLADGMTASSVQTIRIFIGQRT